MSSRSASIPKRNNEPWTLCDGGLIPSWAKDPKIADKTINARVGLAYEDLQLNELIAQFDLPLSG
jgi:putative SOS response-associated peptidase YedK